YTYTTPGFYLTPNTTYAWVASAPNSPDSTFYAIRSTSSSNESSPDDWLIADQHLFKSSFSGTWQIGGSPTALQFSVSATAVPEPSSLALVSFASAVVAVGSRGRRRTLGRRQSHRVAVGRT
ncbi:MAG: PEP-CTERM sorting domain-containing protein, partial [Planctomycetota bacterium]